MTMPHFPDHPTLEIVLLFRGGGHYSLLRLPHRPGRSGTWRPPKVIDEKEQSWFTTRRGQNALRQEIGKLKKKTQPRADGRIAKARVEDYRKKSAGLGGLFNSAGKKGRRKCTPCSWKTRRWKRR